MIKGKNLLHIFLLAVFAVLSVGNANAQIDSLIRVGDSLYKAYRFDDAVDVFYEALDMAEDTTSALDSVVIDAVSERLRLAENGSNMSRFVRTPKVVGRKKLSLDEFNHYVSVVADCILKGKRYTRKTHYQAILDMAAKDRRTK